MKLTTVSNSLAIISLISIGICSIKADDPPFNEKYRPQIHYTPAKNWINDPNGLFRDVDDRFHLFYQYNPQDKVWGHMSWGHAISDDLEHWEEQPVAVPEGDGVGIFSGSGVVDYNNTAGFQNSLLYPTQPAYVLIYTGNTNDEQNQNLAYSLDNGNTFIKYASNPVLRIPGEKNFRDPKVFWFGPQEKWVMVVSLSSQQKVAFYSSPNLKDWSKTGEFGISVQENIQWECPDLFFITCPLTGFQKWVLVVNVNPGGYQGGSGARYFLGSFDGLTFTMEDPTRTHDYIDYGSDFYAVTSYSTKLDRWNITRKLSFGWMSNWNYANALPTDPWKGQMSVPRELKLYIYTFFNKPYNETYKFFLSNTPNRDFGISKVSTDKVLNITDNKDNIATLNQKIKTFLEANNNPELLQIIVNFTKPVGDYDFGLNVRTNYKDVKTVVGVKRDNYLVLDRSASGNTLEIDSFKNQKDIKTEWDTYNEQWGKIEIILDRSSVEAFFFSWLSVTDLIFPDDASRGVEIWASDVDKVGVAWMTITVLESAHQQQQKSHQTIQSQKSSKFLIEQ